MSVARCYISLALAIGNSTVLHIFMARTDRQTNIRLSIELKERLGEAARRNNRTLNAEIVHRLERSLVESAAKALPEEAITAILETRAIVGQLIDLKSPPDAPFPWKRKKAT
jgi:predicted DNA-binding protein